MILVSNERGSAELQPLVQRLGVTCQVRHITGDACFEGFLPSLGSIVVGVERKRLSDLSACIDDGRLSGLQLIEMRQDYRLNFLIVEGAWRPHENGLIMELFYSKKREALVWGEMQPRTMYHKLRRFLFSVTMSGIPVLFTLTPEHTAFELTELFHWLQKTKHDALLQLYDKDLPEIGPVSLIPHNKKRPGLVRKWAACLDGIDVVRSASAELVFPCGYDLATGSLEEWLRVDGLGPTTARRVFSQIRGLR